MILGCSVAIFYTAFHDLFIPSILFKNLGEAANLPTSTFSFFFPYQIVMVFAVCLPILYLLPVRMERTTFRTTLTVVGIKFIWVLLIIFLRPMEGGVISAWSPSSAMRRYGYLGVMALDIIQNSKPVVNNELLINCKQDAELNPFARLDTDFRTHSIVVIQVESLDSIILKKQVGGVEVMPTMTALASVVPPIVLETHHNSVSGSIGTDFQFLTGYRQSGQKNSFHYNLTPLAASSLPLFCNSKGASFQYFHGNSPAFWRRYGIFKELGLPSWYSSINVPQTEFSGWGASDMDMVTALLECAANDKSGSRLYYWVTLSSHAPFNLVRHSLLNGISTDDRVANVFNYTDGQIKRLINHWPFDTTLFMVFGDHQAPIPGHEKSTVPAFLFTLIHGQVQPLQFKGKVPYVIEVPTLHNLVKEILLPAPNPTGYLKSKE